MTFGRRKIVAVAIGVMGTAGLAAGAVAATSGSSDDADDLAEAINKRAGSTITADDVTGAYQDVLKANLAEAVAAGRITQAQADEMLQRAQSGPGLPPLGMAGRGPGGHGPHADVLEPVAAKLKLTEAELRTKLEAGATLTAIAKEQGVSRADLITTIRAALTAAGVPTDRIADLAAHIADDTRRGGMGRQGRGPRP